MSATQAAAHRAVAILSAGDIAAEMADRLGCGLHQVCVHEAAHAVLAMQFGDVPSMIYASRQYGGLVQLGAVRTSPRPSHTEDRCDADKIAAINTVEPVDIKAIRAEVEAILREHWDLVTIIASRLTQKLAVSEEASMTGHELAWMNFFYQQRKGA